MLVDGVGFRDHGIAGWSEVVSGWTVWFRFWDCDETVMYVNSFCYYTLNYKSYPVIYLSFSLRRR